MAGTLAAGRLVAVRAALLVPLVVALSSPRGVAQESWTATSATGAPAPSSGHVGVWTGSRMLVWGTGGWPAGNGAVFDPASNTWTGTTSIAGAPERRTRQTAVWTGSRMIVWGGFGYVSGGCVSSGAVYDPSDDAWTPTRAAGAPSPRWFHTAVWTGSRMIVWGGGNAQLSAYSNTGALYDPATDTWAPTATSGAPVARAGHTAVWTGSRMLVWGGWSGGSGLTTGGLYDPATDTWTALSTTGAPGPRAGQVAVWTGSKMVVWGGADTVDDNNGGVYDPVTDSWAAMTTVGAPSPRTESTAVWTGSRMIVWGGLHGDGATLVALGTGGLYDPATDTWAPLTTTGAPGPRAYHAAVWTGSKMVVWGGDDYTTGTLATGGIYENPALLPEPTGFYTVAPCRVADTRRPDDPGGGPVLAGKTVRTFPLSGGPCGVASTASAVSVNVTAVQAAGAGYLTLFPGDWVSPPLASSINFSAGQTRANNAIVPLATDGSGTVKVKNGSASPVHFVLDVNGYFQ